VIEHPGTRNTSKNVVAVVACLKRTSVSFFLCPFAKAAWFLKPWFPRSEVFTQNANYFASVLFYLLSIGHPEEV
jgi:hypothetical protein